MPGRRPGFDQEINLKGVLPIEALSCSTLDDRTPSSTGCKKLSKSSSAKAVRSFLVQCKFEPC